MEKTDQEIIEVLRKSGDLARLKNRIDEIIGHHCLVLVISRAEKKNEEFFFQMLKEKSKSDKVLEQLSRSCCKEIMLYLARAQQRKKIIKFNCKDFEEAIVFPLIHGQALYGFLIIIIPQGKLNDEINNIISDFINISLEKAIKEIELIKLHSTIRPRAIALSTVHTVHRLISSTLDIDELLPRLARLCLQVLRARYCAIYMKEDGKLLRKAEAVVSDKQKRKVRESKAIKKSAELGEIIRSSKYISVPLIEEEVIGVIFLREKQNQRPFDANDQEILAVMAEQAIIAIRNAKLHEDRGRLLWESIKLLGKALDVKSPKTYTHSMSFLELVMEIADKCGLSEEEKKALRYATLVLDAGKVAVPEEVLKKPQRLTKEEYQSIKQHPEKSAEIVRSIKAFEPVVPILLYHHERYDGKGYPNGLKGEEIPIGARVISLADAFEAMICKRPYRGGFSLEKAIEEIKKECGKQFDPKIVKAFLEIVSEGKINRMACRMRKEFEKKL